MRIKGTDQSSSERWQQTSFTVIMASSSGKSGSEVSLIYYQKPCIGNDRSGRAQPPVQLIFPDGGFGLGMPVKDPSEDNGQQRNERSNFAVLISGPERSPHDIAPIRGLQAAFLVLAAFNLVITSAMYFNAQRVDTTKVAPPASPVVGIFQEVPSDRRNIEDVNYAFTIIILLLGAVSVVLESAVGISAYCLATLLNFLLGTSALPFFVYSTRYIFDMFMLYLALVLRSRLIYTVLPVHLRPQPGQ